MLAAGHVIDGKYEILIKIGEGGMSTVYLAIDRRLNKQWAVKELKLTGDGPKDELIAESFSTEAAMMRGLSHPLLPRIVDIIREGQAVYVVMDFIEGMPLSAVLAKHGPLPQESVIEWAIALCDALQYLHSLKPPIIYRDMKPHNIMLKPDGTVALIDFGIARYFKEAPPETPVTDTVMLGTKGYAPPELWAQGRQSDARSDIYSLGATMHHLLTGKSPTEPPYEPLPIRQYDAKLSPGLERVIDKCVKPNPAERYQSCAELIYALESYEKADASYIRGLRKRRNAFAAASAAAAVLLLAGVVTMAMSRMMLSNDYDNLLLLAQAASTQSAAEGYYLKAAEAMPTDCRAYLGLVELYKRDGAFSEAEAARYEGALLANLPKLRSEAGDYPKLAFETGKLYWYYYTYGQGSGDNQFARIAAAEQWMRDAAAAEGFEGAQAAKAYAGIASFETKINAQLSEGSDGAMYAPYFADLCEVCQLASGEANDVVSLRTSRIALQALEVYARKFKAAGVTEEEADVLFRDAVRLLDSVHPTSAEFEQQQEQIRDRLASTERSLGDAYRAEAPTPAVSQALGQATGPAASQAQGQALGQAPGPLQGRLRVQTQGQAQTQGQSQELGLAQTQGRVQSW